MSQPLMGKSQAALAPLAGRARARKRMFTSERGLGLAGLALAVASGSFAAGFPPAIARNMFMPSIALR